MATKPTNTYRWAQESGGTKHNIVEPSSGHKDEGWVAGKGALSPFFNWLANGAHEWILYLRDAVFVGEAGQPGATITGGSGAGGKGLVVTAGGTNENGTETTGTGTGAGLVATGGSSNGSGGEFTGGSTNGRGVQASASGSGAAVEGINTGAGDAITGDSGGGSGNGGHFVGNATRTSLHLTPQSFTPGSGPSAGVEGNLYHNSQDHFPLYHNGNGFVVPGSHLPIVSKSGTYTATLYDHTILCDASGGAFTINLPAAANNTGHLLRIKKIDATANAITIDGNLSETIDGATTQSLAAQWDTMTLHCNGTSWFIVAIDP